MGTEALGFANQSSGIPTKRIPTIGFPHSSLLKPSVCPDKSGHASDDAPIFNTKPENQILGEVMQKVPQSKNKSLSSEMTQSGFTSFTPSKKEPRKESSISNSSLSKILSFDFSKLKDTSMKHSEFKICPPSSANIEESKEADPLSGQRQGELSQRRDVVFKTIIRDMRKFYIEDFNKCTSYVKRKRYKRKDFYLTCVDEYINVEHIHEASLKNGRPIKDFNIYCGALIYPKELEKILTKKSHKKTTEEVYESLYKFSLGKMKSLLMKDAIFNLFMTYYNSEIKHGDRLNINKTMKKHQVLYVEAYKILVNLNSKAKGSK